MSLFTPVSGLFGGSLIGLSAATLLLGNGDILGASGILSSFIINPRKTLTDLSNKWKISFLVSFLITVQLYVKFVESDIGHYIIIGNGANAKTVSSLGYVIGGFLIGFGARLANGCTSGHGICGLARFSKRSLAAVASFMITAILSASICGTGCPMAKILRESPENAVFPSSRGQFIVSTITALALCMMISDVMIPRLTVSDTDPVKQKEDEDEKTNNKRKIIGSALSASLFALGLAFSKMATIPKMYSFLNLQGLRNGTYDPTLLTVMGGGVIVSFLSYQFVPGFNMFKKCNTLSSPLMMKDSCGCFNVPTNKTIDFKLIFGASSFGLGWGLGGLCPGPALFLAGAGFPQIAFAWWPSFFAGAFLGEQAKKIF